MKLVLENKPLPLPKLICIQGVIYNLNGGWMFHWKETPALQFRQAERWREWARRLPFGARN